MAQQPATIPLSGPVQIANLLVRTDWVRMVSFLGYVTAKLVLHGWKPEPTLWLDCQEYLAAAGQSIGDSHLWAGPRPPGYPLFLMLCHSSPVVIVTTQVLISSIAWWFLAETLGRQAGPAIGTATLLFSFLPVVHWWEGQVLTESLTMSLGCLISGLWLSWLAAQATPAEHIPRRRVLLLPFLVTVEVLLLSVRDMNCVWLAACTLTLWVLVWRGPTKYRVRTVCMNVITVFIMSTLSVTSASLGKRWLPGMYHVISRRIVQNDSYLDYFRNRGAPMSEELVRAVRAGNRSRTSPMFTDRRFAGWMARRARGEYNKFLVLRMDYTCGVLFRDGFGLHIADEPFEVAKEARSTGIGRFYLSTLGVPPGMILLVALPAIVVLRLRSRRRQPCVPLSIVATSTYAGACALVAGSLLFECGNDSYRHCHLGRAVGLLLTSLSSVWLLLHVARTLQTAVRRSTTMSHGRSLR